MRIAGNEIKSLTKKGYLCYLVFNKEEWNKMPTTNLLIKEEEDHIRRILPLLLKRDIQFRREINVILTETFPTREEMKQILDELRIFRKETQQRFEATDKRFEQIDKRFEEMQKEMHLGFEQQRKEMYLRFEQQHKEMYLGFEQQHKETKRLGISLRALGSRWGKEAEVTIRKTLQELLLKKIEAKEVSEWKIKDKEGKVGAPNSQIQVDLLIRNGQHFLVEIKSSADEAHVDRLYKIGELYTEKVGIAPKLLFVAVSMEEEGVNLCQKLGIQLITYDELED
ncbi:MAG: DUF3782 domain-containing protein [bacterium]|nr:DUF3782 domain-containing protein [bacterium]